MMSVKFIEKINKLECSGKGDNIGDVYIVLPDDFNPINRYPLLIALHGSGREAFSYRDIPFYMKQRDMVIEGGYIFATISNGSNTFGTDEGYYNFIKLYEYMNKNYKIYDSISLFSSSAGGLLMHRIYRSMPAQIGLLMGVFPLFDPTVFPPIKSLLNAYKATDANNLISKVQHLNPLKYPLNIYKKTRIAISHGISDDLVPISQSEKLLKQVTEFGGEMTLYKSSGGHSINNFAIYDTELFYTALREQKNLLSKTDE